MRLQETSLVAIKIIDFPVFDESVTHGRTDGRTDGPTDRRTDGPTDGRMDRPSYRDARTHLKTEQKREAAMEDLNALVFSQEWSAIS